MKDNVFRYNVKSAIFIVTVLMGMIPLTSYSGERLPEAKDYPVNSIYTGKPAKDIDNNDDFTHEFRTRFRAAMQGDVVFAGEYAQAVWGCGSSGCHTVALINKRTGRALDRAFTVYYGGDENEIPIGEEVVFMKKDSKLIIMHGMDETTGKYYSYYYVLKDNGVELIRKIEEVK